MSVTVGRVGLETYAEAKLSFSLEGGTTGGEDDNFEEAYEGVWVGTGRTRGRGRIGERRARLKGRAFRASW